MPADLIIYALVAAGLIFWLRSILGTRHGEERQRPNPLLATENIRSQMPPELAMTEQKPNAQDAIAELAKNPTPVLSINNKSAENGLLEIAGADKEFDIKFFMQAAQDAFAMIVEAFAAGERETLKDLVDPKVFTAFDLAITEREAKGHIQKTEIHAVQKASVIEASLNGRKALITLRFEAQESSVTRDADFNIIEGNPDKVAKIVDVWTFERDLKSRDLIWLLVETRGDFDDDNTLIPDVVA